MSFQGYDTGLISNGTSLSSGIPLGGRVPYNVVLPAAWTAANVSFQVSVDGSYYGSLFNDDGTEYTATNTYTLASSGVGRAIAIDGTKFAGANYVKIQSGTQAAPVAQGADRTVQLGMRDL